MKSFVVIGAGRFGRSVAKTLEDLGHEVLIIDNDSELIQQVSNDVTHAVVADATDEMTLKSLGVRNFDKAIVAIGSDLEASILVTVNLKTLGVKDIVAKATNETHAKILRKIGADDVVLPETEMGVRVAHNLSQSNVVECIFLSQEHSIVEVEVPPIWVGKTIGELDFRVKHSVNIIAIKQEEQLNISPKAEDVLKTKDVLIVIGKTTDIEKIQFNH